MSTVTVTVSDSEPERLGLVTRSLPLEPHPQHDPRYHLRSGRVRLGASESLSLSSFTTQLRPLNSRKCRFERALNAVHRTECDIECLNRKDCEPATG
jgi:hypothetical protein